MPNKIALLWMILEIIARAAGKNVCSAFKRFQSWLCSYWLNQIGRRSITVKGWKVTMQRTKT